MKFKRKLLSLLLCLSLPLALSACGGKDDAGENAKAADEVSVAMTTGSEPSGGFDPVFGWGAGEHVHEPLIQSTLITTTTDMEFENDLATDYYSSDNGLTWTFTIRNDVKFTDGTPLTAQDVAFTYNTIIHTDGSVIDLSMMDEAVALDDTTVEFHLNKPYNAILYSIAVVGILPEASYDKNYGENPIGSGRYMLKQWDKGEQIILEANPDYYGEAPKMKRVTILFMEEDAALAAVKSGKVDIAYTGAAYSNLNVKGYHLLSCASVDCRGLSLPTVKTGSTFDGYDAGNDVTADLAIRRAMNYGVDRELMAENTLNGYGTPCYSVCDGMPWATDKIRIATDQEKAKQILANGGWKDSDGDGIVEKDGLKASVTLYYSAGDSTRQAMAVDFSNQMKDIGIEVNTEGSDWDSIYTHQYTDLVLWGWGSNSPSEVYNLTYSKGWGNYPLYTDSEVDNLLDEGLATAEISDSYTYYQQAMEKVAGDGAATWVWFANVDHLYFARDGLNVAEQKIHPHGHGWSLVNNIDQWTWE